MLVNFLVGITSLQYIKDKIPAPNVYVIQRFHYVYRKDKKTIESTTQVELNTYIHTLATVVDGED